MPNNSLKPQETLKWPVTNHEKPIAILSVHSWSLTCSPLKSCREAKKQRIVFQVPSFFSRLLLFIFNFYLENKSSCCSFPSTWIMKPPKRKPAIGSDPTKILSLLSYVFQGPATKTPKNKIGLVKWWNRKVGDFTDFTTGEIRPRLMCLSYRSTYDNHSRAWAARWNKSP